MESVKKITIIILLLTIFAVGTTHAIDTVDAAKWKKYDSGTYKDEYPVAGYKKVSSYQSYTKGNNQLYVNIYSHPKEGNKKLVEKVVFTKKNNIIKVSGKDYFSGEKETLYYETKWSVKKVYKFMMNDAIKFKKVPPAKSAFDKKSFSVNKDNFNAYGIKSNNNYIDALFYKNNEEFSSFIVEKDGNNIIYKEYNQKRKLTAKESLNQLKVQHQFTKQREIKLLINLNHN